MHWDDLRGLICLSDKKTLAAAAKSLGISTATLTRKIDRLERELSLPLVRRSPTGTTLTPEGVRIVSVARLGNEYLEQVEVIASAMSSGDIRDPIRISSTEPIIADVLAPNVVHLQRQHPNVQLDLVVSTEISNLQRQEAELAIRLARPTEPSLITRKLADVSFGVFVARSLQRESKFRAWQEYPFVSYNQSYGEIPERVWLATHGVNANVKLLSSSTRAQLHAVKAGSGAAVLPLYMAEVEPDLVKLDTPAIQKRQLWLVFHRDLKKHPALAKVRDWAKQSCVDVLK